MTNSSRGLVRAALAFALTGLLAVLSGGLLIITGGPASSVPDDECVPTDAWTETTGWLTESPGAGWVQIDERTVDGELVTEAVDQWWHWNPGDAGGVQDPTGPPPLPGWNTDHGNHNGIPAPPNEPYNVSNDNSGKSSWFYHEVRDAVYEQVTEYRFSLDTPEVTHVEYVYSYEHPAVECEDETEPPEVLPTEETEPPEVLPTEATEEPAEPAGPSDTTGPEQPAGLEVLGEQATRPTRPVPQAVEAGVGGRTAAEMWGAGLVGGGLVMLLAAGGTLMGARRLEAS